MSNEQREALKIALEIVHEEGTDIPLENPCRRCRKLASALLEMRAAGVEFGKVYIFSESTKNRMTLDARRLRREAKALREGE